MQWTQVSIRTSEEGLDALCGVLLGLGVSGFEIEEKSTLDELLANNGARWDYIDEAVLQSAPVQGAVLRFYLADNEQGQGQLAKIGERLALLRQGEDAALFGGLEMQTRPVREEDWENNWKQYFHPFPVGERLMVHPSWEPCPEAEGRIPLKIDPGSSFGTGQHHTTRLCLEALERELRPADRVLDLGCGSGILMIGALLLGASCAVGVDIDSNSVRIAGENLAQNALAPDSFRLLCGNILEDAALVRELGAGYDLITANIVADVLKEMSGMLPAFLKPGGGLVVSGIIEERAQEVIDCLCEAGFTLNRTDNSGGWTAATFTLPR